MTECINLQQTFGATYKITYDEEAFEGRHSKRDPWLMQIPCRLGTIYPYGGQILALEVDGHPKAVRALAAVAGVRLHQDGNREKTFLFPVTVFDQVAEIVRPKRRRRLSPEQRALLAAHGFRKRQCVGMLDAQADTWRANINSP